MEYSPVLADGLGAGDADTGRDAAGHQWGDSLVSLPDSRGSRRLLGLREPCDSDDQMEDKSPVVNWVLPAQLGSQLGGEYD